MEFLLHTNLVAINGIYKPGINRVAATYSYSYSFSQFFSAAAIAAQKLENVADFFCPMSSAIPMITS